MIKGCILSRLYYDTEDGYKFTIKNVKLNKDLLKSDKNYSPNNGYYNYNDDEPVKKEEVLYEEEQVMNDKSNSINYNQDNS
jgi:hypothetical protein